MRRKVWKYFSWRALWHLRYIPRAVALFERPVALLGNYIGFSGGTRDYRTRSGQCFSNVCPVETESIFCSFVKGDYGDIDVEGDVIDIGANIGAFSLYAACRPKAKRVFAFEPMNDTFGRLVGNVNLSVGGERVVCVHAAVGSRCGFVEMIPGANSMLHRSSEVTEKASQSQYTVRAVSLASVFDAYDIRNCALLKLDCQGAEYEILENLPRVYFERICAIRLEMHQRTDGRAPEDLSRFIQSQGFIVDKHTAKHLIWFRRGS